MAETTKKHTDLDYRQAITKSYNKEGGTLGVDGFIAGKVGRRVDLTLTDTNTSNDTEVYSFSESGTQLYEITIVYTDSTREILQSVERTA